MRVRCAESLLCVCTYTHVFVCVWCERGICELCASKLYPDQKKNGNVNILYKANQSSRIEEDINREQSDMHAQ